MSLSFVPRQIKRNKNIFMGYFVRNYNYYGICVQVKLKNKKTANTKVTLKSDYFLFALRK